MMNLLKKYENELGTLAVVGFVVFFVWAVWVVSAFNEDVAEIRAAATIEPVETFDFACKHNRVTHAVELALQRGSEYVNRAVEDCDVVVKGEVDDFRIAVLVTMSERVAIIIETRYVPAGNPSEYVNFINNDLSPLVDEAILHVTGQAVMCSDANTVVMENDKCLYGGDQD